MPQSVSQYINVAPEVFSKTGAFDAILDMDSKLFIDPHLLRVTEAKELAKSYAKVNRKFSDILQILKASKRQDDIFWRRAVSLFTFPELEGLCIGYSSKGTGGSGMGAKLRRQVIQTAKEIVDAGVTDPEIFELVGLFEEGIGADRVSDMIGRIIADDLRLYSQRIFTNLRAKTQPRKIGDKTYNLVVNPHNGLSILLIPKDILRDLPIAYCWEDIDRVCAANAALRRQLNTTIGRTWKRATSQNVSKRELRQALLTHPDSLRDLLQQYKAKPAEKYDFNNDPAGEFVWCTASQKYVREFPLSLQLPNKPTIDDLEKVVIEICQQFKDLIENNSLGDLLYDGHNKPKKESASQKLFFGIAHSYCKANDLDLSPETNSGRGPVDFKISRGYNGRVLVETKLSTNQQLLHGYATQILEYQKAEKTDCAICVVIDVSGGSSFRVKKLKSLIEKNAQNKVKSPRVIFVDARPKVSASKYKGID